MIEMLRIYSKGFLENVAIEELTPWPFHYLEETLPASFSLDAPTWLLAIPYFFTLTAIVPSTCSMLFSCFGIAPSGPKEALKSFSILSRASAIFFNRIKPESCVKRILH
jgi:hypothetical protein